MEVLRLPSYFEHFINQLFNTSGIELFLTAGGVVLQVLVLLAFVLYSLLFARLWFKFFEYPKIIGYCQQPVNAREFIIATYQAQMALGKTMGFIRTSISICPLLGLVGTVVGMIEIFDVIALKGVSNAQVMAAGVAKAILPTMAGMVVAISAMFIFAYLQRWVVAQKKVLHALSLSSNNAQVKKL